MTERTPIIAGNWKMHNTLAESAALITALTKAGNKNHVEIIVAPSYTSLAKVAELANGSEIKVAAQDGKIKAPLRVPFPLYKPKMPVLPIP